MTLLPRARVAALAAVAILATGTTGCITIRGHVTPGDVPSAADRREKALGFVGLTLRLAFAATRSEPRVEIEFNEADTGKRVKVLARSGFRLGGEPSPLFFPLEKGRWVIRSAVIRVPGGDHGGLRFEPMEIPLQAQRVVGTFEVAADEFLHLGHQDVSVTLSHGGEERSAMFTQEFRPALPSAALWDPALAPLSRVAPVARAYLRRAGEGKPVEKVAWHAEGNTDAGKAGKAAGAGGAPAGETRDAALQRVLPELGFDLRKCARAHLPKFEGAVEVEVLVSPEGRFEDAQFKSQAWRDAAPARACVLDAFRARAALPGRDDGRSDTWTLTFEVR